MQYGYQTPQENDIELIHINNNNDNDNNNNNINFILLHLGLQTRQSKWH